MPLLFIETAQRTSSMHLLIELFSYIDDRAGELAAIADRVRVAGLACARADDSLRR